MRAVVDGVSWRRERHTMEMAFRAARRALAEAMPADTFTLEVELGATSRGPCRSVVDGDTLGRPRELSHHSIRKSR